MQTILESLSIYCRDAIGKRCDLKLVLPDGVIDEFYKTFQVKEKIIPVWNKDGDKIRLIYCSGGTVELIKESEKI